MVCGVFIFSRFGERSYNRYEINNPREIPLLHCCYWMIEGIASSPSIQRSSVSGVKREFLHVDRYDN